MVCAGCHKALGGGVELGATGEFRVPSSAEIAALAADEEGGERPRAVNVCSWCGKLEREVKKLLGRADVALCNECVALCVDILDAELGDEWR